MRKRTAVPILVICAVALAIDATVSSAVFAQASAPATDKSGAAAPAAKSDAAAPKTDAAAAAPDASTGGTTQVNPKELLDKGEAALKAGDFNAAIAAFNEVDNLAKQSIGPQAEQVHLVALTGRGRAFLGLKENTSAMNDFNAVLGESSNFLPALLARGKLNIDLNKFEEALADFQNAVQADPSNNEALAGYGHALVANGRPDEAVTPLTRVITADPKNAEAYRYRGMAYASLNKTKQAIEDLEHALTLSPDDYEAQFQLGIVNMRKEDYKAAGEHFSKAVELYKPKPGQEELPYVQGHLGVANAFLELGKLAKDPANKKTAFQLDVQASQKVISLLDKKNPAHTVAYAAALYQRAVGERMLGEYAAAIKSFTEALELNPELADAYFRRGVCFTLINEDRMAVSDFQAAAHLAQNAGDHDPRSNLWEGFCYAKLGEYHEALRAYGDAIAASDRYTPAYYNRALTYMRMGEYNKAIIDFNDAIRFDPTNSDYYFKRGLAYQLMGDNKHAASSFATAIEFDKNNAGAYRRMSDVQQSLGNSELSTQYRQKADQVAPKKTP